MAGAQALATAVQDVLKQDNGARAGSRTPRPSDCQAQGRRSIRVHQSRFEFRPDSSLIDWFTTVHESRPDRPSDGWRMFADGGVPAWSAMSEFLYELAGCLSDLFRDLIPSCIAVLL